MCFSRGTTAPIRAKEVVMLQITDSAARTLKETLLNVSDE
jgi:hypothetical protein